MRIFPCMDLYGNSNYFFDSNKRHFPFVREGFTYETSYFEASDNGSHTIIYLYDHNKNKENACFFLR